MFWRAWNPSLNCSDFNSASLNTWLTNTAKQSITVALSKKCNLFFCLWNTHMWNMFFFYCLFIPVYSARFYFSFGAGFAGSSRLRITHLSPLIPGKDGLLANNLWLCVKVGLRKEILEASQLREGCAFCRICLGAGDRARHQASSFGVCLQPWHEGWRKGALTPVPSGRFAVVCVYAAWTSWVWSATGASRCCQHDGNNYCAPLGAFWDRRECSLVSGNVGELPTVQEYPTKIDVEISAPLWMLSLAVLAFSKL